MTEPVGQLSAGERARLLREALAREAPASRSRPSTAPASYAQEQLWFLDQLSPGNANYNVPFRFTIDGPLEAAALQDALRQCARRHDSLRTALRPAPTGLTQIIAPEMELPLTTVDVSAEPDPSAAAWATTLELAAQPFALDRAPLWRACLLRLGPTRHVLVWVASHAVADGWSIGLLMRELAEGYRAARGRGGSPRPDPPQFTEYALRQRDALTPARVSELLAFWRTALDGCPLLDFPFDHPRPQQPSSRGATAIASIPPATVDSVRAAAAQLSVTPFAVLLAAYHALLARTCASTDVAIGTPVACRDTAELDDVMGSLVNTVAVRADSADDPTFEQFVRRVAAQTMAAVAHREVPFSLVVEHLRPPRDGRYNPVCQTVFSFGATPGGDQEHLLDEGVRVRSAGVSNGTVRFDLELAVDPEPDGWVARLEYATDLIERPSAERFCGRYLALLSEAVSYPQRRLSDLLAPAPPEGSTVPTAPTASEEDSMVAAATFLAAQFGLAPATIVAGTPPPGPAARLVGLLPAVASAGTASPVDQLWVTTGEEPPPAATAVLLLGDHPGHAPRWTTRAGTTVWAAVTPPDVPGAVLARYIGGEEDRLAVGRPLPGTRAELLDRADRPALPGTVGRLSLATAGSAVVPGWLLHDRGDGTLVWPGRTFELPGSAVTSPTDAWLVQRLTELWRQALGRSEIGPDADFFELGGHSLLAGELVTRVRDTLHCEFTLVEFFQTLTIRAVAALLAPRLPRATDDPAPPEITPDLLAQVEQMSDEDVARLLHQSRSGT